MNSDKKTGLSYCVFLVFLAMILIFTASAQSSEKKQPDDSADLKVCFFANSQDDDIGAIFFNEEFARFIGRKYKKILLPEDKKQAIPELLQKDSCDVIANRVPISDAIKKFATPFQFFIQNLVVVINEKNIEKYNEIEDLGQKITLENENSEIFHLLKTLNLKKGPVKIKVSEQADANLLQTKLQLLEEGKIDFFLAPYYQTVNFLCADNSNATIAFPIETKLERNFYFISNKRKGYLSKKFKNYLGLSLNHQDSYLSHAFYKKFGYSYKYFFDIFEDSNIERSSEKRIRLNRPEYFK